MSIAPAAQLRTTQRSALAAGIPRVRDGKL